MVLWCASSARRLAPLAVGSYLQSQIVFVFIYAIVGVGLLLLAGFAGQVSLGHAAFLAIGAYTAGYMQRLGVPFLVYLPLSGVISGAVGALVGFPALRLSGIYLVIATIAFGFIVEEVAARWESVTNGNDGLRIRQIELFGWTLNREGYGFYYLCLGLLIAVLVVALNLLRSPTGRAFVAIRDSETAAQSMGINLAVYKVVAFSISAGMTGLAGCLFAHKLSFISPEMFTLLLSIEFVIVVLIGGVGSLHGAVLGSIFIVMVDPFLTFLKDDVPRTAGIGAHTWLRQCQRAREHARGHRQRRRAQRCDLRHHHHPVYRLRALRTLRALAQDPVSFSSCFRSTGRRHSGGRRPT